MISTHETHCLGAITQSACSRRRLPKTGQKWTKVMINRKTEAGDCNDGVGVGVWGVGCGCVGVGVSVLFYRNWQRFPPTARTLGCKYPSSHQRKYNYDVVLWYSWHSIYIAICICIGYNEQRNCTSDYFHFNKYATSHDDVIKWKHFPRNWPFVREIHRSPVNFPHKGQWRGALMFSLIYAWINDWVNNREAGELRRQHGHYDVIVMR